MSAMILYDTPRMATFSPDAAGRQQLQRQLDDAYRYTLVSPPSSVRELRLDPKTRKTQLGARYMSSALHRVCRVAGPGLSKLVTNVAGDGRQEDIARELFSVPVACSIFNAVVDLRFGSLLSQYQLVTDTRHKTIEGFLGPKTHYLENGSFVEMADGVLSDVNAVFAGATMVGRRLHIRYLMPEPLRTPFGEYRRGYSFALTEAGDDAIRAYTTYQRTSDGICCLEASNLRRQRQKRTGSRFAEKLRQLFGSLLRTSPRDFVSDVTRIGQARVFQAVDGPAYERTVASWQRRFKLAGAPSDIAGRILARLTGQDNPLASPLTPAQLLAKTEYELFVIAMEEGNRRSQRVRELVERAAFTVFFGE